MKTKTGRNVPGSLPSFLDDTKMVLIVVYGIPTFNYSRGLTKTFGPLEWQQPEVQEAATVPQCLPAGGGLNEEQPRRRSTEAILVGKSSTGRQEPLHEPSVRRKKKGLPLHFKPQWLQRCKPSWLVKP